MKFAGFYKRFWELCPRCVKASCIKLWDILFRSLKGPLDKEGKISLLILIIVLGFSLAVFYHYAQSYYFNNPYPQNTFLFDPRFKFWDFLLPVNASADLDPYNTAKSGYYGGYLPFGQFVAYLFSIIKPVQYSLLVYFGSFFLCLILMVKHYLYGFSSKLTYHQLLVIFVLVFLTYPVLFAVDRSNFDLIICIFLFLFALIYERQKVGLSTIFLALAIAIKPITAIFAVIYLTNKQYRQAILLTFNVAFLSALSLAMFKDGLFAETTKFFTAIMPSAHVLIEGITFRFSNSLYDFGEIVARLLSQPSLETIYLTSSIEFRLVYILAALIILILFTFYFLKKPQPFSKFMLISTILLILLPFTSSDYRLIYLFIPLLMYLRDNNHTRHDLAIIILWGLLLVPKNYYNLNLPAQNYGYSDQNIGMLINPLILIGLLVLIVCDRSSEVVSESKSIIYPAIRL